MLKIIPLLRESMQYAVPYNFLALEARKKLKMTKSFNKFEEIVKISIILRVCICSTKTYSSNNVHNN